MTTRYNWTEKDDALLTKLWPKTPIDQLARKFDLSNQQIKYRARALKLTPKKTWSRHGNSHTTNDGE